MKRCQECGRSFPDSKKFCNHCGERLIESIEKPSAAEAGQATNSDTKCGQCGGELSNQRAKFCRYCGTPISADEKETDPKQEEETADEPSFTFPSMRSSSVKPLASSSFLIYGSVGIVAVAVLAFFTWSYWNEPAAPLLPNEEAATEIEMAETPPRQRPGPQAQKTEPEPVREVVKQEVQRPSTRQQLKSPPQVSEPGNAPSQGQRGILRETGGIMFPPGVFISDFSGPRLFGHSRGGFRFESASSRWLEYYDGKHTHTFNEVGNDDSWIYLIDYSRKMALRLPRSQGWAQWSADGKQWNSIYEVFPGREIPPPPPDQDPSGDTRTLAEADQGESVEDESDTVIDRLYAGTRDKPQQARIAEKPRTPMFYVEHQHAFGRNCRGNLYVLENRFKYESSTNPKCNFEYLFADLKKAETTGFPQGFRIEPKKGRKYQFITTEGPAILEASHR